MYGEFGFWGLYIAGLIQCFAMMLLYCAEKVERDGEFKANAGTIVFIAIAWPLSSLAILYYLAVMAGDRMKHGRAGNE